MRKVGKIELVHRKHPTGRVAEVQAPNATLTAEEDLFDEMPIANVSSGLQARHELELVPTYSGVSMTTYQLLSTILEIMV